MIGGALNAALLGGFAAFSLLIGAMIAVRLKPAPRVTGAVMGFGAGALIGSIAYELMPESALSLGRVDILLGFAAGALTFFVGDWLIDRLGGAHRKEIEAGAGGGEAPAGGSGMAIFLGTLLDGVPESLVLGISLGMGAAVATGASAARAEGLSIAFLIAVFISNIPEGIAGTSSMIADGQSRRRVLLMWVALVLASALASALGYGFARLVPAVDGRVIQAFAAGAMLTMLADTMLPEGVRHAGRVVGLLTTLGFLTAAVLSVLE